MKRKDPVTPELRDAVLRRDRGCVAPRIECDHTWHKGYPCAGRLTLDHVKSEPMMGKRAPSDMGHLACLCWRHHMDGWATSHRPELRAYLASVA